jgi:hypothetical protein
MRQVHRGGDRSLAFDLVHSGESTSLADELLEGLGSSAGLVIAELGF